MQCAVWCVVPSKCAVAEKRLRSTVLRYGRYATLQHLY